MQKKMISAVAAVVAGIVLAAPAGAAEWLLSGDESKIAFGSVKKNAVGEAHHFSGLKGSVTNDGKATVEIDVTSVETWIDIRNERMLKHVFASAEYPIAVITAEIDMDEVNGLKPGETTTVTAAAMLEVAGAEVALDADLFVAALADNKVLVTTDEMIMLSTADLGIDAGVDELKELAKLPSITRVAPVTLRLVFEKG
ncbi:MAG: YceI family protein [Pseudomonadota bacterium]